MTTATKTAAELFESLLSAAKLRAGLGNLLAEQVSAYYCENYEKMLDEDLVDDVAKLVAVRYYGGLSEEELQPYDVLVQGLCYEADDCMQLYFAVLAAGNAYEDWGCMGAEMDLKDGSYGEFCLLR